MLWKLHVAGWHGWMVALGILVGLPFAASRFADAVNATGLLALLAPLVLFYTYTWVLHYSVGERLSDCAEHATSNANIDAGSADRLSGARNCTVRVHQHINGGFASCWRAKPAG